MTNTQENNQELDQDIKEYFGEESVKDIAKKEPKILSISDLQKSGSFAPRLPVKKLVKWTDTNTDEEFEAYVFVRRQSYKTFSVFVEDNKNVADKLKTALMISKCLASDETGQKDLFTYEQVCDLEFHITVALLEAINEVNYKKK